MNVPPLGAVNAPSRAPKKGAPPLLLGEFTADDVLLWLQTTAFKQRAGPGAVSSAQRRSLILDEVRSLKATFAGA